MAKIGTWSATPGNNSATPPDGWPEGQAPSTVNDCAREMMAAIRVYAQDAQWFDHNLVPTFINATSFTVPGDQTAILQAGRQLKLYDASTIYRSIAAVSFTAVTTISLDAGTAVTASLSSFAVAALSQTNPALPRRISANAVECVTLSAGTATVPTAAITTATITTLNVTTLNGLTGAQVNTALGYTALGSGQSAFAPAQVCEIGRYIDFHGTNAGTDYDTRLECGAGNGAAGGGVLNVTANNGLVCSGNITAFSDERLKKEWRDPPSNFLECLAGLRSGTYARIDSGIRQVGVSAQQLQRFLPEAVQVNADDGYLSIAYGNAALVACVELARELVAVRVELAVLKAQLS